MRVAQTAPYRELKLLRARLKQVSSLLLDVERGHEGSDDLLSHAVAVTGDVADRIYIYQKRERGTA